MKFWGLNNFLRTGIFVWCFALVSSGAMFAQTPDSLLTAPGKSHSRVVSVFLAPTILIGAGLASMEDRGWYSSYDAYACIQRNYPDFHTTVEDYLMFVPAATVYGLNWAGVKGKNAFVDRSLVYLSSLSLALATNMLIKNFADVERPDGSDRNSMPSNHTAIAFVSATLLFEEYKEKSIWYGIAGYSVATATGVLRMLNNKHWMSDVLVGAGLGILATKTIYWIYPPIKDRLSKRPGHRSKNQLSLLPYVSPHHYGLCLNYQIR